MNTAESTSAMAMTAPADLVHGLVCAASPGESPSANVALDVLHHHDGVVDHDADGEHQPEQGQVVQREAEGRHGGEGAHQRDGDRDHRISAVRQLWRKTSTTDDHEGDGLEQGLVDLVDRLLDELRRVVGDAVLDILRKFFLRFSITLRTEAAASRALVPGRWKAPMPMAGVSVEEGVGGVVPSGPSRRGDVLQPHEAAIGGLDDDVGELLRALEAPLRLHDELEGLARGGGAASSARRRPPGRSARTGTRGRPRWSARRRRACSGRARCVGVLAAAEDRDGRPDRRGAAAHRRGC